jgi:hypothetical protein
MSIKTENNPQAQQPEAAANPLFQLMERITRLNLKAFQAKSLESLIFIILNDTSYIIRYDRAVLWDYTSSKPELLGISGQAKLNKDAEIIQKWTILLKAIPEAEKAQELTEESFSGDAKEAWKSINQQTRNSILWFPIPVDDKMTAALWLERWGLDKDPNAPQALELLSTYLIKGYSAAFSRFKSRLGLKQFFFARHKFLTSLLVLAAILTLVHLPLRVVAHCEVVPKDPVLVTAPLEGIIENVLVQPGQTVTKGLPLFEYDKRAPLHDLKAAQKDVQVMQAEVARAATLGLSDPRSLKELAILKLKLEKGLVQLDLAQYQASKLTVTAPENGVATVDNPDEWRGKPVKIGEKVMIISNPKETKLRLWIPEDDNIIFDEKKPIAVYLNIDPDTRLNAHIDFVSNESTINDKNMTTFIAEARWDKQPEDVKLGLKGTAVLYGEKVSLFYYIFRKPWAHLRSMLGF